MSGRIDVNKIGDWHECIICDYWYFLEINFIFQPELWNHCHDIMQKAVTFNDVAVFSVKKVIKRIYFLG